MHLTNNNYSDIIKELKAKGIEIQGNSISDTLAFLINNGYVDNFIDIEWKDFEFVLFKNCSGEPQDIHLINNIENVHLKIALLDYWLKHRNLIISNDPFHVDFYNSYETRPVIWKQTLDTILNKEKYDVRRVIEGQPNSDERIRILEERVALLERKNHFKFIKINQLKKEQIEDVESDLRIAATQNSTTFVKALCKWKALNLLDDIESVSATEIFNESCKHFILKFKMNAFQKSWSKRHYLK